MQLNRQAFEWLKAQIQGPQSHPLTPGLVWMFVDTQHWETCA